jgi:hypothetical protein
LSAGLAPLLGALIGVLGGAVYWLGAQIWPSNVAVIASMAATSLLTTELSRTSPATRTDWWSRVFCLLIKYNALMALSAAKLPFVVPANLGLGLIMICGHAASFALAVSVTGVSSGSLSIALLIGFAPAAVLGIPGLVGLAGAVVGSLGFAAYLRFERSAGSRDALDMTRLLTEACFYLGALAAWSYV